MRDESDADDVSSDVDEDDWNTTSNDGGDSSEDTDSI